MKRLLLLIFLIVSGCSSPHGTQRSDRVGELPPAPDTEARFEHPREVRLFEVSEGGGRLATLDASTIAIWSLPEMELEHVLESPQSSIGPSSALEFPSGVKLSHDGTRLAVLNRVNHLYLWEEGKEQGFHEVVVHFSYQPDLLIGFSPKGHLLWRSGRSVIRYDATADALEVIGDSDYATMVSGSLATGFLLWSGEPEVLSFEGGEPELHALSTGWESRPDVVPPYDAERGRLYLVSGRNPVRVELASGEHQEWSTDALRGTPSPFSKHPSGAVLSVDGEQLVVVFGSHIEVWDALEARLMASFAPPEEHVRENFPRKIYAVALNGDALFVLSPDQQLFRYRVGDWSLDGHWSL